MPPRRTTPTNDPKAELGSFDRHGEKVPRAAKVAHVKKAGQTRNHECHWPGCTEQVPPAMFSCKPHWFALPKDLRDRIWNAYRPGQEISMTPSESYVDAARAVQDWIAKQAAPAKDDERILDAFDILVEKTGATRGRVIEEWKERSAIRQYLGGVSQAEAEIAALGDVENVLGKQSTLRFTKGAHYVPDGDQYW